MPPKKQPTTPLSSRPTSEAPGSQDEDVQTFSLLDMELLHHFITQTSLGLADAETIHVWQINIPALAYTNGHLMSGIIAIAALHKATTASDSGPYIQRAMEALNMGLPRLRSLVANLENESPHAVVAYSALITLYGFSLPPVRFRGQKLENPLPALLEAFSLLQSQIPILAMTWAHIHNGPVGAFVVEDWFVDLENDDFVQDIEGMMAETQPFKNKMIGKIAELDRDVHMYGDLESLEAYRDTLLRLQRIVKKFLADDYKLGGPLSQSPPKQFMWPSKIKSRFITMLQDMDHPALTMLGFWAFFLPNSCWYTCGWRPWILDFLVELDMHQPWSRHVRWIHAMAKGCP